MKKDKFESIRIFRREIFKKPEPEFWKVSPSTPVLQSKLILAPSVLKFMR